MPTSIPELIALELIARLDQITVGNGYEFTASNVKRVNRDAIDWTPENLSIVVMQLGSERDTSLDCPGNPPANGYALGFDVSGYIRQTDRVDSGGPGPGPGPGTRLATSDDDTLINAMEASIKKAIAAGSTSWHTFDGNARHAEFGSTQKFLSEQHIGCTVSLTVRYRISEIDPYEVR